MSERTAGIVTGGGSGIGAASARQFAARGCRVVIADLSGDAAERVAAEIVQSGGVATGHGVDIRDSAAMDALAQEAVASYGRLDFLVASAGAVERSSVVDGDPERWRRVVDTNVTGTMISVRAVLPRMIEQQHGHVLLVASMSGRGVHVGEPAYVASKWGEVGFGNALRLEVEPLGIKVTLIEPGLVDTPFTLGNPKADLMKQTITPLSADDVARSILFAFEQPPHVGINEIALRPVGQSSASATAEKSIAASGPAL